MIKHPIYHEFNLDNMVGNSKPIRITHIDDTNVDVVELCVRQGGSKIDLTGATVTARIVLHAKRDYLINDNVQCTVNDSGNVLIPFDNAVIELPKGVLKIEVNIRRAEDVLTLQFPLWVMVNDTILAAAEVLPESEGTIPELLEAVKEELERVEGYVDEEQVKDIIDSVLSGVTTNVPTLLIDNTVNQQYNPEGHLIWYYIDSDGTRHNLFDFTPYLGGTDDYNDLDNKPQFVVANSPEGFGINIPVQGVIELMTFYLQSDQNNRKVLRVKDNAIAFSMLSSALQKEMFKDYGRLKDIPNDFFTNSSSVPYANALWDIRRTDLLGMPIPARGWLFNYLCGTTRIQFYLTDYFNDLEYQFRLFFRVQYMGGFHEWIELTGGGSEIASAAVNQNGTISFYDADGNLLFTTTGASVIGPQGAPGQDYVLTSQDKTDIANIVLQELPTTQGVLYGD